MSIDVVMRAAFAVGRVLAGIEPPTEADRAEALEAMTAVIEAEFAREAGIRKRHLAEATREAERAVCELRWVEWCAYKGELATVRGLAAHMARNGFPSARRVREYLAGRGRSTRGNSVRPIAGLGADSPRESARTQQQDSPI